MIRKLLISLGLVALLALAGLGLFAWKQYSALEQPLALEELQLLDVQSGDTPSGVFQRLETQGLLRDSFWLRVYWRLNLSGQSLHSGDRKSVV